MTLAEAVKLLTDYADSHEGITGEAEAARVVLNGLSDVQKWSVAGKHGACAMAGCQFNNEVRRYEALEKYAESLAEALRFYAGPETYHGMAWRFESPTGGFDTDLELEHGHLNYEGDYMPGKRARAALAKNPKCGAECNDATGRGTESALTPGLQPEKESK